MAPKQDWLEKDFYRTLNVDNDASDKEIQKSYRKLARKYHPDANPDDKAAEDKFKQISEAYETLGSEDTRREYDSFRKHGPTSFGFGGAGSAGGHARSSGPTGFEAGDFSDIFSDLFGGQSQQSKRQGAGQDLEADLSISFIDAVRGTQTKITINTEVACKNCSGTGAAAGTTPDLCRVCHGRGSQSNDQGFFAVSQPCANCQGRGMVIENPCGNCSGTGSNRKPRTITVKIPPGVTDGQRIRRGHHHIADIVAPQRLRHFVRPCAPTAKQGIHFSHKLGHLLQKSSARDLSNAPQHHARRTLQQIQ